MSAFRIDPVGPADADCLAAMARDFNAEDGHPLDAAGEAAVRSIARPDPLAPTWILRAGEEVVGYVALSLGHSILNGGPDAFVDNLYLRPPWRGRGLGRQVLAFVEDWARRHGLRALHLEVERGNARARELYERAGFAASPRLLMTKPL